MALDPDAFYAHALEAADAEQRLPLSRMTMWDAEAVLVERRHDEDPATCRTCTREDGVWTNARWRLTRIGGCGVPLVMMLIPRAHHDMGDLPDDLAAELGVLSAHLTRHVEALPNISRCHVYRVGDGGAHLHVWLFARPLGQGQLYGSWLPVWDDLLPEYPDDLAQRDAETVARALTESYSG